ncbi:MAG TPA: hypothetical protein VEO56_09135, partial [Bacteroidota bacterium]|nr:hypothetical protein [Bacteroidota bacterium]
IMWQNFYSYLQTRYMLEPFYFNPFTNGEPLLTPDLMKFALQESLEISTEMVSLADELESLVQAQQSGKLSSIIKN